LHNLASAYGDAGNFVDAARVSEMAMQAGLDGPQTWLVNARPKFGLNDFVGAEAGYRRALERQPDNAGALMELSQLIWMRTGDRAKSLAVIETASTIPSEHAFMAFLRAQAIEFMGDSQAALNLLLSVIVRPGFSSSVRAPMLAFAAQLAAQTNDAAGAIALAEQALRLAPDDDPGALEAKVRALLAVGDGQQASVWAEKLLTFAPMNQRFIAFQATAWRMIGDGRYGELYDFARFVKSAKINVPAAWPTLDAYLTDLVQELKAAHPFKAHPYGHSVRQGSQRSDVLSEQSRAITAFVGAISDPINAYLENLGSGIGPFRSRNTGNAQMIGNWSVWLRLGGHHADHVHPDGWISSAFYAELPASINAGGREGWLRFGKPGLPLGNAMPAEHWIRPEPGLLALFPSYIWHGTEQFSGNMPRLTIAFDLVPV
jgi:tetratricopeptide (TPR) repeat protein